MFLILVHSAPAAANDSTTPPARSRISDACTCGPGRLPSTRYTCMTCAAFHHYARQVEARRDFERRRAVGGGHAH